MRNPKDLSNLRSLRSHLPLLSRRLRAVIRKAGAKHDMLIANFEEVFGQPHLAPQNYLDHYSMVADKIGLGIKNWFPVELIVRGWHKSDIKPVSVPKPGTRERYLYDLGSSLRDYARTINPKLPE